MISKKGKDVPVTPKLLDNEVLEREGEMVAGTISPNDENLLEVSNENMATTSGLFKPSCLYRENRGNRNKEDRSKC